jgi:hypothetical protein
MHLVHEKFDVWTGPKIIFMYVLSLKSDDYNVTTSNNKIILLHETINTDRLTEIQEMITVLLTFSVLS